MRYRHSQVLEITGVSKDALRYWKKHISPLSQKDGRSEGYTFAEVLGIAVVAEAVAGFGVAVERLAPVANPLFALVAKATEPGREPGFLSLQPDSVRWDAELPGAVARCTLIIPIGPVAAQIRARIVAGELPEVPPVQFDLPIPGQRVVGMTRP
jgi:hypothetical protein